MSARFPALEDEMCDFRSGGLSSGRSPDRLDALVWALSALMLTTGGEAAGEGDVREGCSRADCVPSSVARVAVGVPAAQV